MLNVKVKVFAGDGKLRDGTITELITQVEALGCQVLSDTESLAVGLLIDALRTVQQTLLLLSEAAADPTLTDVQVRLLLSTELKPPTDADIQWASTTSSESRRTL